MEKSPNPPPQTSNKHHTPGFKVKILKSKLKPNTKASRLVPTADAENAYEAIFVIQCFSD